MALRASGTMAIRVKEEDEDVVRAIGIQFHMEVNGEIKELSEI